MKANLKLLLTGLLIVSAWGCSSAPKQDALSESELLGTDTSAAVEESTDEATETNPFANSTEFADTTETSTAEADAARDAFVEPTNMYDSSAYDTSTSLGAGSSGRGH